jgi:ESCRT-I complex subunit VPS28
MNLDEEVRPYTTSAEREKTENLATLYSIIVSLEYLERAYVRDSVTGKEWVCLLSQGQGWCQVCSGMYQIIGSIQESYEIGGRWYWWSREFHETVQGELISSWAGKLDEMIWIESSSF